MREWGLLRGLALGALLVATGCGGGSNRVLESITVNGASSLSGTIYTATGHYSADPMTVPNIPVAWFTTGPGLDPPGGSTWDFSLSTAPFTGTAVAPCSKNGTTFTVVAYASTNPSAPTSESMPTQTFITLVFDHTTPTEGGFVAGTGQFVCDTNPAIR
jgi:hypothetical protein